MIEIDGKIYRNIFEELAYIEKQLDKVLNSELDFDKKN